MKLCPICDQEVKGTFCKTCKRFVKPVEYKNDIYLNTSHFHEKDCYGKAPQNYAETEAKRSAVYKESPTAVDSKKSYTEQTTYTEKTTYAQPGSAKMAQAVANSTPIPVEPVSGTDKAVFKVKKNNKAQSLSVIFVMIAVIFGAFVSHMKEKDGELFSGLGEAVDQITTSITGEGTKTSAESTEKPDADWIVRCNELGYPELGNIVPTDIWEGGDDGTTFYIFAPSDIRDQKVSCNQIGHFALKVDEIESLLSKYDDYYIMTKEDLQNGCYLYDDGTYVGTYFSSYEDFYVNGMTGCMYYDTGSGEMHNLSLMTQGDWNGVSEVIELLLDKADCGYDASKAGSESLESVAGDLFKEYGNDSQVMAGEIPATDIIDLGGGVHCSISLSYILNEDSTQSDLWYQTDIYKY